LDGAASERGDDVNVSEESTACGVAGM